jgi:hypothetical protein
MSSNNQSEKENKEKKNEKKENWGERWGKRHPTASRMIVIASIAVGVILFVLEVTGPPT